MFSLISRDPFESDTEMSGFESSPRMITFFYCAIESHSPLIKMLDAVEQVPSSAAVGSLNYPIKISYEWVVIKLNCHGFEIKTARNWEIHVEGRINFQPRGGR